MIRRDVNFGKGKIKGLVTISRKYWDIGKLTTNADKILLKGNKTSFELATKEIKSVEIVTHRTLKILKITMHNEDHYHVSSIPEEPAAMGADPNDYFMFLEQDTERKNERLLTALQEFLNP